MKWWNNIDFHTMLWEKFTWRVEKIIEQRRFFRDDIFRNLTHIILEEENTNREFTIFLWQDKYDFPNNIQKETFIGWNFIPTSNGKKTIETWEDWKYLIDWNKIDLRGELSTYCWIVKWTINWINFDVLKILNILNSWPGNWDDPIIELQNLSKWEFANLPLEFRIYLHSYKWDLSTSIINHQDVFKAENYLQELEDFRKIFLWKKTY